MIPTGRVFGVGRVLAEPQRALQPLEGDSAEEAQGHAPQLCRTTTDELCWGPVSSGQALGQTNSATKAKIDLLLDLIFCFLFLFCVCFPFFPHVASASFVVFFPFGVRETKPSFALGS